MEPSDTLVSSDRADGGGGLATKISAVFESFVLLEITRLFIICSDSTEFMLKALERLKSFDLIESSVPV